MRNLKYFTQYIVVITCFIFFKFLGPKLSSKLSGKIFEIIGPFFRSKKLFTKISREHYQMLAPKN